MSIIPIICVKSVPRTSKMLCSIFSWHSTHGGSHFDELADESGSCMLWLHHMDAHGHARFKDNHKGNLGRGIAIYVFVANLDETYKIVRKKRLTIVEPLHENTNAGFHEFTFQDKNGYHFTVAEDIQ